MVELSDRGRRPSRPSNRWPLRS